MECCRLGSSDIKISRITHGCMELGGGQWEVLDEEHNIRLLNTALENGITLFDTAESYGNGRSEEIVGKALKGKRQQCTIATKVAKQNLRAKDIRSSVSNSLKRLGTDYIDLLYVHWPNVEIPIEETITEFSRLKQEGVIRAIGVSNFSLGQIKEAMQYGTIDALQPEYNLLERSIEKELLPFCEKNSISVLSYNSIAKGILSGAFHLFGAKLSDWDFRNQKPLFQKYNMEKEVPLINLLKETADKHNSTLSQIAIAWMLKQPGMSSAIVGTQNPKHFVENIRAIDVKLSEEEAAALKDCSKTVIQSLRMA